MVVLSRLRYRLRRMGKGAVRWWLLIPLSFVLIIIVIAGVFLSSLTDREISADVLTLRLVREDIRSQTLEGIGLSTNKSLSPNLLDEGSFDQLSFRKELQARSLGGSEFSIHALDQKPAFYRNPDLPMEDRLALFEGGKIRLDRLEQGRLYLVGEGLIHSGRDDVVIEEISLSPVGEPRWSTFAARYSEDRQLLDTMVVLEDGRVLLNAHSELSQVLAGRTPRSLGGLFYVDKRPLAWTTHGAIYEYSSEEMHWSLLVPGVPGEVEIHDLIAIDEGSYLAASDEGFYVANDESWEAVGAPEVTQGRWDLARYGETLYALRAGELYANFPAWIDYEEDLVYEDVSIFHPSGQRWVQIHEGSSTASLQEDPYGELLFLDPTELVWYALRDLQQEEADLFKIDSAYAFTQDVLLDTQKPPTSHLIPLGRGRLLAETADGTYLLSGTEAGGMRLFSDKTSSYLALSDLSLLELREGEARRLQLASTIRLDFPETLETGEVYRATLEKHLSPEAFEAFAGSYPWTVLSGTHSYELQEIGIDGLLEEQPSYKMIVEPEEGTSEIRQSIALDKGVRGGEIMTFSFRASSEKTKEPQSIRLVLSGPFRTYSLQSKRIQPETRSYSMSFRLPEFQVDREATSLDLSLQWESDAQLILDDLQLMTRDGNDETGVSTALRYEIETLQPRRFRFCLDENSGFTEHMSTGLHSKSFRIRLNQVLQTCDLMGVEPWIVIPADWTAEEHAVLFQYLASSIDDPLGRQRLEDGWGQAWLQRLPRVYFEVSAGSPDSHDDLLHAARVNQALTAMTQSSSYDAVKNRVIFLDGLDYSGGRMLSAADGHAKTLDLAQYKPLVEEDGELTKTRILDLYYAETPRLSDGAEPWLASLQDSGSSTLLTDLVATVLEWMQQGIVVNLDQTIFLLEATDEALMSDHLSKRDADRLLLWETFNELTQGRRLEIRLDSDADILTWEDLTLLAVEAGSEIHILAVADIQGDRKKIEFSMNQFEAERMRLHRFDREGRLYEERDSNRPSTTFTLAPGDILFVTLDSEK